MYKVVRKTDRGLESAIVSSRDISFGRFSIIYKENEWTWPEFGKIMVFETLAQAHDFCWVNSINECKVWTCQTLNCKPAKRIQNICLNTDLKDYWSLLQAFPEMADVIGTVPPKGTHFCDAIKLMEEI